MIEQGLLQLLGATSSVTTLIGTDPANHPQVYWKLAPKGIKTPCIVLSRITTGDTYTMAGPSGLRDGLFQVDCYVDSKGTGSTAAYYLTRKVSKAVRQLLESYRGTLPDAEATVVNGIFTEKDWDMDYEEGAMGFVFRALLQFRVWYYEA